MCTAGPGISGNHSGSFICKVIQPANKPYKYPEKNLQYAEVDNCDIHVQLLIRYKRAQKSRMLHL